jgi:pimeloyl-ACP methyl ester carboxylesterase
MGGKVAQIVAKRRPSGLLGLVLVAPAPPTPMSVPEAQRAAMRASYGSREGGLQALSVLAGGPLPDDLREQVIEDTLRGAMEDISAGLDAVKIPVSIVVGRNDRVEHESALREIFGRLLPQATFRVLERSGHLSQVHRRRHPLPRCRGL